MSAEATRWAWQQALKPTTKLVLLALADRANPGGECWPSTARLIKDTGLYRETIHAAINTLEAVKIIQVSRATGCGNRYKLLVQPSQNQSEKADQSDFADQSEKGASTSLVLPTTQAAFADYHQSAFADTNLKEESKKNLKNILAENQTEKSAETPSQSKPKKAAAPKAKKTEKTVSQEKFDEAFAHYPARSGSNSKSKAQKAWNARLQAGANPQEIIDGVIRYRAWCESTGKIGSEFVKQAATFFGPDQHYLEPFVISPKTTAGANPYEHKKQQSATIADAILGKSSQFNGTEPGGYGTGGSTICQDAGDLPEVLDGEFFIVGRT